VSIDNDDNDNENLAQMTLRTGQRRTPCQERAFLANNSLKPFYI